ncbi:hypothetical protein BDR22DRAFT_851474 [Usnea florida]
MVSPLDPSFPSNLSAYSRLSADRYLVETCSPCNLSTSLRPTILVAPAKQLTYPASPTFLSVLTHPKSPVRVKQATTSPTGHLTLPNPNHHPTSVCQQPLSSTNSHSQP